MTAHDDDVTGDLSGQYLKKQDLADGPLTFQIASVGKVVFEARGGKPAESKWVLTFDADPVRKLTLNKTNLSILAKAFGKKTGPWTGQTIEVYLDEGVMFAGQLTGGLRVRLPKPSRRPAPATTWAAAHPAVRLQGAVTTPKTEHSIRVVDVPQRVLEALERHKADCPPIGRPPVQGDEHDGDAAVGQDDPGG